MKPECPNCGKEYNAGDEVCSDCGLVFPFTTDVLAPSTVLQGRYEIQELSHTGGMGYIYLAKDKKLYDRLCIVKQVKEPVKSDSDLKKLEEEARRMAKLSHPNVAMILDHFVEDKHYFLVVERISGKALSEVFEERHGQLNEEEVITWAISMCDVISYIHKQDIIHRDISPDNVMLTDEGNIKFVDFGTLRELRYITTKGTAGMGKYGYTPPEQWQSKPVPQSDIFALGATIYYLLTGSLPLSREYLSGRGPQRPDFSPDFPPIRQKNPEISPELEAVLQKALQLDVSNRYSSAADLGVELRSLARVAVPRRKPKEAAKPVLSVDPQSLKFVDVRVGSRATKTLTIRNTGTGRLTGRITTSHQWMNVSTTEIDLETGEQEILVSLDKSYLRPGIVAEGEIEIDTNGGRVKATVILSAARATAKQVPHTVPEPARPKRLIRFAVIGSALLILVAIIAGASMMARSSTSNNVVGDVAHHITATKIAYVISSKDKVYEIHAMDIDGTNQVQLTSGGKDYAPSFSPDRKKIAFVSERNGDAEIYTMNIDGSGQSRLTSSIGEAYEPLWSPDGKKIAFTTGPFAMDATIYVMNTDGNNLKPWHNCKGSPFLEWSPDSKKIAFADNGEICIKNINDGSERRLTHGADDFAPSWSPDGKRIVFIRSYKNDYKYELWVMNSDGSNQMEIKYSERMVDPRSPKWSPDGKRIALVDAGFGGYRSLYVMNSDGSETTYLLCDYGGIDYAWSPDGSKIVATFSNDSGSKIYVFDVYTSSKKMVLQNNYSIWGAIW